MCEWRGACALCEGSEVGASVFVVVCVREGASVDQSDEAKANADKHMH